MTVKPFDFSCDSLCRLIAAQMVVPLSEVQPHVLLVGDLGIDSLEMQSLLLAIEDIHGVMPEAHHLRRVRTVADLHAVVLQLLEARATEGAASTAS